ncbi:sensor domain-containing protein [Marinobacter confluentis]|uniref:EAL domain-containing protein n=1 Tax=Marinobacter confluentis TaxID=1697557 RepID=A0A4Z1CHV5_9GAMM|nr:EAL domain-containing protein [Marinobacter confluentis]TGN40282.1 EAL domain-containing protein [Marinobacter confluentis]
MGRSNAFDPNRLYETVFYQILQEVHIWQLEKDANGAIQTWRLLNANPAALKNWGKSLNEVKGKTTDEIFPGVEATRAFMPIVEKIFTEKQPHSWEVNFAGTDQTLQMTSVPVDDDVFISTGVDVSHIRRSEKELKISQERLSIATEAAHIGIWEYDLLSQKLIWDTSMYQIYGVPISTPDLPLTIWENGLHQDDRKRINYDLEKSVKTGNDFDSEFRIICQKTRQIKHIHAHAVFKEGGADDSDKLIGVNIDISDRKQAQQEVELLAYFDPLTELPNRTMISDRLNQSLALSERTQTYSALLFIDVDNFKKINDTAGHAVGDELLTEFARRVKDKIRKADTLGRFGGDEFVIILNSLSGNLKTAIYLSDQFAHKVVELIREPFAISTGPETITASFGITLFKGGISAGDVLREADFAMYKAKESGRNQIHFYNPDMQRLFLERVQIENDLLTAINAGQIEVHYQLQVHEDGTIRGAEALARWRHPTKGFISPDQFIGIAEDSGQIQELGSWIFIKACSDLKDQIQPYVDPEFVMAINVSSLQIFEKEFTDTIQQQIETTGVNPSQVKIEITESAIIDGPEDIHEKMLTLKALGVRFSLDDFGTGYSSLTSLKNLPIDELKIDRSFVHDVLLDRNSSAIAKSVIVLAQSLGLEVVAEGIETNSQMTALKDMGCHAFQGYLFSKPLPLDDFLSIIKNTR